VKKTDIAQEFSKALGLSTTQAMNFSQNFIRVSLLT